MDRPATIALIVLVVVVLLVILLPMLAHIPGNLLCYSPSCA